MSLSGAEWAPRKESSPSLLTIFLAGSIAGPASLVVVHPLDTIRTRLQTSSTSCFRDPMHCLSITLSNEGFRGLYKGMLFPLLAQGVYKSVLFGTYEMSTNVFVHDRHYRHLQDYLLCGGLAGAAVSFVVTPVELVRNRIMVNYTMHSTVRKELRAILQTSSPRAPSSAKRNVRGLWRGLFVTMGRDVPGFSAYMLAFDASKSYLERSCRTGSNSASAGGVVVDMAAGAFAGSVYWALVMPMDTIKSLVQTNTQNISTGVLVREKVTTEGWKSLWRGYSLSIARGAPAGAVTFAVFHQGTRWLHLGGIST